MSSITVDYSSYTDPTTITDIDSTCTLSFDNFSCVSACVGLTITNDAATKTLTLE